MVHVLMSPCGTWLAAATAAGEVHVFEATKIVAGAVASQPVVMLRLPSATASLRDMAWLGGGALLLAADEGILAVFAVPGGALPDKICDSVNRSICSSSRSNVPLRVWSVPVPCHRPSRRACDDADWGVYAVAASADLSVVAASVVNQVLCFDTSSGMACAPPLLGSFAQTHSEAVTRLAFDPSEPRRIVSAGDDGLLCLLDTSAADEDDAIISVCNVGAPVADFGFCGARGGLAWAVSRAFAVSLWDLEAASCLARLDCHADPLLLTLPPPATLLGCREAGAGAASAAPPRLLLICADGVGCVHLCNANLSPGARLAAVAAVLPDQSALQISASLSGGHAAAARAIAWANAVDGNGDAGGSVAFTGGDDGTLAAWAEASARTTLTRSSGARLLRGDLLPPAPPFGAPSVARAFATLALQRPISPPVTNGSGTSAAAFLFGNDHAGDGTPMDEQAARAMQAAASIDDDDVPPRFGAASRTRSLLPASQRGAGRT